MTSDKDVVRSTEVLQSMLIGAWIVDGDWLRECQKQGQKVDETQFEARHLVSCDDPKKSNVISGKAFSRARQFKMQMVCGCGAYLPTGGFISQQVKMA